MELPAPLAPFLAHFRHFLLCGKEVVVCVCFAAGGDTAVSLHLFIPRALRAPVTA